MVLVSVVGDFDSGILPVFYYHIEEIAVHLLVHDRKDAARAERLQAGMRRFCEHHGYDPLLMSIPYDEDSHDAVEALARTLLRHKGSRRLLFNPTEALSSTAVLLYGLLQPHGGIMVEYDRRENTLNYMQNGKIRSETVSPMRITEHLMLKNVAYERRGDMAQIHAREQAVAAMMRSSSRFSRYRKAWHNRPKNGRPQGYDDIENALEACGKFDDAAFIDGGIFEEYCYALLKTLPFDDVELGLRATFYPDTPQAFVNEFDILCMKDNHLHIVECKFRNRVDGEALVYKYDSVMELIDEDAKAVLAVVGGDNVQTLRGRRIKQFSDGVKLRARHSDIFIYHEARFDPRRFVQEVGDFLLGTES